MQTFGIGSVLGTTLRVWTRNLLPFTLIAFLMYLPALLLRFEVAQSEWNLYMFPLGILLNTLISAAITYGVVMELDNARPSFRDCVVIGLGQLVPVLSVVLVSGFAILGGMLLLFIPGVIVMLMLYVAVPVAMVEKVGVMEALGRSQKLTKGHKAEVFVILLVSWVASFGLTYVAKDVFPAAVLGYVSVAIEAIIASFGAVLTAVIYTALRREKDGISVPELASAFARFSAR